jgi:hypothetical protein
MTSSDDSLLDPPLVDAADLERFWLDLMGPLGFGSRKLWLLMLTDDHRPVRQITQIDDVPVVVEAGSCAGLMEVCQMLVTEVVPGGSIALLLTRPGRHPMDVGDTAWARALVDAARRAQVPLWPVHFANDRELRVFPPEDVLMPRSG